MKYKIFLSSPSDVNPERAAAGRVVRRINAELPTGTGFELVMWEDDYYTADSTFQEQIDNPADCDIVVCIIWGRLGSELPEQFRDEDGDLPTGTEYEFEIAYKQASASDPKVPDILVYKKQSDPTTRVRDAAEAQRQLRKVDQFWKKWFRNEQGHFVAAFSSFFDTEEFEERFESNLRRWLDDRQTPLVWTQGSPFRGLEPFDFEHAAIFFGRTREIERARARSLSNLVAGLGILIILGPSGSGKSSLVRAGLVPRLMHSGGSNDLSRLDLFVTTTPAQLMQSAEGNWSAGVAQLLFSVEELAQVLAAGDFDTSEGLASLLARGGPEAIRPVLRGLDRLHEDQGMIFVLDQLEEIFEWDPTAAEQFVTLLAHFAQSGRVLVIATMRAEYQHRMSEFPALEKLCALRDVAGPNDPRATLNIGRAGMADIRDMILKPAAVAGLEYEAAQDELPGLAARIEEQSSPDTLPAMQLLLSELFKQRKDNLLTHAAFDTLGGVKGVMASSGDAVLRKVPNTVSACLPALTRLLVQANAEGLIVSKRLPLISLAQGSDELRLARALQDAGLLTSDGDSLRIVHESLITGWHAMHTVVLQEEQNLAVFNRISAQFRGFESARKGRAQSAAGAYLTGLPLHEALALKRLWGANAMEARLTGVSKFIDVSAQVDRRKRWVGNAIKGGLAATLVLAGFFLYQLDRSQTQAELRDHMANAEARLRNREWTRALSAARSALDIEKSVETRSLALSTLIEFSSAHFQQEIRGTFASVSFGPVARVTALSPTQGPMQLNPQETAPGVLPPLSDASSTPKYARLWTLTDGTKVVLRSDGQGLVIAPDETVAELPTAPRGFSLFWTAQSALWESDGVVHIAMGSLGGAGRLLRCELPASAVTCSETLLRTGLDAVSFDPDTGKLATANREGVVVHGVRGEETAIQLPVLSDGPARSLAWMAQGKLLVAGISQGGLAVLQPDAAPAEWRVMPPALAVAAGAKTIIALAPSPDTRHLAYDCATERICIAGLSDEGTSLTLQDVFYRRAQPFKELLWDRSGETVYGVHADDKLSVWNRHPENAIASLISPASAEVMTVAVDRANGRTVSGDAVGHLAIHKNTGNFKADLGQGPINHVAVSSAGDIAVATANGGIITLPLNTLEPSAAPSQAAGLQRVAWIDNGQKIAATSSTSLFVSRSDDGMETIAFHSLELGETASGKNTIGGVTSSPEGADALISLSTGGLYRVRAGALEPILPPDLTADDLSSLDIDISHNGQFLVATRSDDLVKIYDLPTSTLALQLSIPTRDSKAVRFSPGADKLAVLASSGRVHVWSLAQAPLSAEKLFSFDPAPSFPAADALPYKSAWLDWENDDTLVVAHQRLGVIRIDLNTDLLDARLRHVLTAVEN